MAVAYWRENASKPSPRRVATSSAGRYRAICFSAENEPTGLAYRFNYFNVITARVLNVI